MSWYVAGRFPLFQQIWKSRIFLEKSWKKHHPQKGVGDYPGISWEKCSGFSVGCRSRMIFFMCPQNEFIHAPWITTRWWFETCFIFTPTWGNGPIWLAHSFQIWVVQKKAPTRKNVWLLQHPSDPIESMCGTFTYMKTMKMSHSWIGKYMPESSHKWHGWHGWCRDGTFGILPTKIRSQLFATEEIWLTK